MGQQQVLLVILAIVIVAIAAYVALNVFGSGFGSASLDSLQADLATIAESAQSYYHKPAMIGGGGGSFEGIDFTKFSFSRGINIDDENPLRAENENGTFQISDISPQDFIITGTLRGQEETTVAVRTCPNSYQLGEVSIDGTAPDSPACM